MKPNRKKLAYLIYFLFFVIVVTVLVSMFLSTNNQLQQYSDYTFSIDHPEGFSASFDSERDAVIRFKSEDSDEYIEVLGEPYETASINLDTAKKMSNFFKSSENNSENSLIEFDESSSPKTLFIESARSEGLSTKSTYYFYDKYVWSVTIGHDRDSELSNTASKIFGSFMPKEK